MAVLIYSELESLALDDLQANVTVDKPVTTGAGSELERALNDAYATVWEMSGGGIIRIGGPSLWTPSPTSTTTGALTGIVTAINEVIHLWASTSDTSTGGGSADIELRRVELAEIQYRRSLGAVIGSYATPKVYALTRIRTAAPADVNKLYLDVWPGVSGYYFPAHYVPQFTPLDPTVVTTPDVNDLESRDIAHLAAMALAPRTGRAELVPDIALKISENTRLGLERKMTAQQHGKQDTI